MITSEPVVFENLWTVREVAAFLQASRSWVYERAESGLMPSIRIGGLLRFNAEAVRNWANGTPTKVLRIPAER
jgi:excisionase family DNA binding protein